MKKKKILIDVSVYVSLILISLVYAYVFDSDNLALFGYEPHPFLLITVILSVYRGLLFAVLSSIASTVIYLLLLNMQVDYEQVETILNWTYFSMPVSIIFLSIFAGLIRQTTYDRYKQVLSKQEEDNKILKNVESLMKKMELENRELKERLVTREHSIQQLYEISQLMNELDYDVLIDNFLSVLNRFSYVEKAKFFDYENRLLKQKTVFNMDQGNGTITDNENMLIQTAIRLKRYVSLVDAENIEELQLSKNDPVLVVPLFKEDLSAWGVVLIYEIPFLKYIPTTFKMIELYGKWLTQSMSKMKQFDELESSLFIDSDINAYKYHYYLDRLDEEIDQAQSQHLPCTVLLISHDSWESLTSGRRKLAKKLLVENLRLVSKKMDVISLGRLDHQLEVLVLGTHERAVGIVAQVRERLNGLKSHDGLLNWDFSYWDYKGGSLKRDQYFHDFKEI